MHISTRTDLSEIRTKQVEEMSGIQLLHIGCYRLL